MQADTAPEADVESRRPIQALQAQISVDVLDIGKRLRAEMLPFPIGDGPRSCGVDAPVIDDTLLPEAALAALAFSNAPQPNQTLSTRSGLIFPLHMLDPGRPVVKADTAPKRFGSQTQNGQRHHRPPFGFGPGFTLPGTVFQLLLLQRAHDEGARSASHPYPHRSHRHAQVVRRTVRFFSTEGV